MAPLNQLRYKYMASHYIAQVSHLIPSEIDAEVIRPVVSTRFEKLGEWAGIHTKLNKEVRNMLQLLHEHEIS